MEVDTSDDEDGHSEDGHSEDDFVEFVNDNNAAEPYSAHRLVPNRSIDFYAMQETVVAELPTHNTVLPHSDNRDPFFVLPLASVLVSASVGLLTFLSGKGGLDVVCYFASNLMQGLIINFRLLPGW